MRNQQRDHPSDRPVQGSKRSVPALAVSRVAMFESMFVPNPTSIVNRSGTRTTPFLWLVVTCLAVAGCGGTTDVFSLNQVYLLNQERATKIELTAAQRADLRDVLSEYFGTPDAPKTGGLDDLLDAQHLQMAAGRVYSDQQGQPFGLYREHCAHCHGLSGDGVGPTSVFLSPYPRDFRRGIYKFKSTMGPATPPTDEDLLNTLRRGIPETAMPAYGLLSDEELLALVDYVKYLTIRGQVERSLIEFAVDELEAEDKLSDFPEDVEATIGFVVRRWKQLEDDVVHVPPRPEPWDLQASIERGRELFLGDVANCVKCHGEHGLGDGENVEYDDWTRELDPQTPEVWREYVELGALTPVQSKPRNLQRRIYHGGGEDEDLYLRIFCGIAGTPMPAAPMKPDGAGLEDRRLTTADIWHLVDFVKYLGTDRVAASE